MKRARRTARPTCVRVWYCFLVLFVIRTIVPVSVVANDLVDFQREVLPILAEHCLACHGPDEGDRQAGLRLDELPAATAELDSGRRAIVPGSAAQSELVRRIDSSDPGEQMPPPEGKPLSEAQKQVLRAWIDAGAEYAEHWSFVLPQRAALPRVADPHWCRNPIDYFVAARRETAGLQPTAEAHRAVLIRRLCYDLIGLPPTPEQVREYLEDRAIDADERLVERLLASPHFGERMAMFWLDAARYSDTDGFQGDAVRTNWPWRDWVIEAFNRNQSFDQFTLEQFAGDLLPDATDSQRLATCFHRNHMTNGEGGRDPEESRIDYVIDRVNTMGTVWLGLTLGCTQCHSHKYDPISQSDYYSLSAFFNSIDEDGRAGGAAKPFLEWQSSAGPAALAEARQWLAFQEGRLSAARAVAEAQFPAWLEQQWQATRGGYSSWRTLPAERLESESGTELVQQSDGIIQAGGADPHHEDYRVVGSLELAHITALKLEVFPHPDHTHGGYSRSDTGHFVLSDIKLRLRRAGDSQVRDITLADAVADYSADAAQHGGYGNVKDALDDDPRNGWASFDARLDQPRQAVFRLESAVELHSGDELIVELQQRALQGRHNLGRFRLSFTSEPGVTTRSVGASPREQLGVVEAAASSEIDSKLREPLFEQWLAENADYVEARTRRDRAAAQLGEIQAASAAVPVMVLAERSAARDTHILLRGAWDQKGAVVARDTPAAVLGWPEELPRDRRGLALWLTDARNPLTARVAVNHLWSLMFGAGLVRTPEDFGRQGEQPTHPELLDWLAVEFIESGWDVKHMLRLMVHSATYRQQSDGAAELHQQDPENRWLARGARYRLPSWMIRDGALQAAGMLNAALSGPPVRPYQPPGIWEEISMGRNHYAPSEGPSRYRRTVYAFWRRSAAPAFLFDSAQRRVCEVRTFRTNTPLQALTLLNDVARLEAARALAGMARGQHVEPTAQIEHMILCVLARPAKDRERSLLVDQYEHALTHYQSHPADTHALLELGQVPEDTATSSPELAAATLVASMILNLDEAITRE